MELMSNSDNVLRGGLTTKHIDVNELLKHVKPEPTVPAILEAKEVAPQTKLFRAPVKDFQISVSELKKNDSLSVNANATEIILVTEGEAGIRDAGISLHAGQPTAVALKGTS